MPKRTAIAICAACLIAGYLAANAPGFQPLNPFKPAHDRPVMRFLSRIAKIGLWVTVFSEPAPCAPEVQYKGRDTNDGSMICHREGW